MLIAMFSLKCWICTAMTETLLICCFFGDDLDYTTQLYGDSNEPLYIRISMNQSGFHGISFLGFERCSP